MPPQEPTPNAPPPNKPPVAVIVGPETVIVDQPVIVDGSGSHDQDAVGGKIKSWEFDFLQGDRIAGSGSPGVVSLQDGYADAGEHTIVLTVWDGPNQTGAKDTAQWVLQVLADAIEPPPAELVIQAPETVVVESTTGPRAVSFVVTTEGGQAPIDLQVEPPSGSVFEIGKTIVTAVAYSTDGQEARAAFVVEVVDASVVIEPLALILPANITVESSDGQPVAVDYEVTTEGGVAPVQVAIDPPSGTLFHVGTRSVDVLAISADGQRQSGTFTVKVISTVPLLVLQVPAAQTLISPTGDPVPATFAATTTGGAPPVTVTYDPPSGSTFAVGTTTVSVVARSADGQEQSGAFTVSVNHVAPGALVLTVAPTREALAPDAHGVTVNIAAVVSGGLEPVTLTATAPGVSLTLNTIRPVFGGKFPIGTTEAQITATDAAGATATAVCAVMVEQYAAPAASPDAHADFDARRARASCVFSYSLRDEAQNAKIIAGDRLHSVYDPGVDALRIGLPNRVMKDGTHTGILNSIPNQVWCSVRMTDIGQTIIIADWRPGPLWNVERGWLSNHKHFNLRRTQDAIWYEPNTNYRRDAPTRLTRTRRYGSLGPPPQTIPGPFKCTEPTGTLESYDSDAVGPVQNNVYAQGEKWVRTMIVCDQRDDGWAEITEWIWVEGEERPSLVLDRVLLSCSISNRPHHFDYEMNSSTQRARDWSVESQALIPYAWCYGRDVTVHRGEPVPLALLTAPVS